LAPQDIGARNIANLLRTFSDMNGLDYAHSDILTCTGRMYGRYTEILIRWMERLEAGQAPIIFEGLRGTELGSGRSASQSARRHSRAFERADVVFLDPERYPQRQVRRMVEQTRIGLQLSKGSSLLLKLHNP
jgi:hypothetical protein